MKIIVFNPHWHDATAGIHNYIKYFLIAYKPSIQLGSKNELSNWYKYLLKNKMSLLGWEYVIGKKQKLNNYDVWVCFAGNSKADNVVIPENFSGLKIYHMMDAVINPVNASNHYQKGKVDFLLAYSQFDSWHPLFQNIFSNFNKRVIPWPFGYNGRFKNIVPWENKQNKCSIMGSIHNIQENENMHLFSSIVYPNIWSHPIRKMIRENISDFNSIIASYLPSENESVNLNYDSPTELNKYKLFLNDDSLTHFPPARTYEGCACGSVMIARNHECFRIFGFKNNDNCILIDEIENPEVIKNTIVKYLDDSDLLKSIHLRSMEHVQNFSHNNLGQALGDIISLLLANRVDDAKNFFN